jgi:hypothetical protein
MHRRKFMSGLGAPYQPSGHTGPHTPPKQNRLVLLCRLQDASALPPNPAVTDTPAAMAAAAKAHGAPGGCMVMIVQPGERNAYDQQVWIGYQYAGRGTRGSVSAAHAWLCAPSRVCALYAPS